MLKHFILILITTFCLVTQSWAETTTPAAPETTPTPKSPIIKPEKPVLNIQHWTLNNGAKIYYVKLNEIPIVDLNIIFNAGSAQDGKLFGLAKFTNASFGEGTSKLNADQIADAMAEVGALYSTSSARDMASVSLRSMTKPEQLNPALKLFANILTDPKLPTKSYNRIKNQILQAIRQQQENPGDIATAAFFKSIYGTAPYGHNPLGTPKTISQITPQKIGGFYHQYYVGNNAIMTIVGNLDRAQAESIAQSTVGQLPAGKAAPSLSEIPINPSQQDKKAITYPSTQTSIRVGEIGVKRTTPDYFAITVGNYILGGSTLTSRLFQAVREERGLSYFIFSRFLAMQQEGPFVISLQTKPKMSQKAIQVINEVTKDFVTKGPSQQELLKAKKHLIGSFPLKFDSNAAIIANLSALAFYQLPLDYFDRYRDNISAVTTGQIIAAFQKHVQPQQFITITVGPQEKPDAKESKTRKS